MQKKRQISLYNGNTSFYLYQKISSTIILNLVFNDQLSVLFVGFFCFTGLSLTLYVGFFCCHPTDSDLQSDDIHFGYFDGLLLSAGLPIQPTGWKHVICRQGGKREFSAWWWKKFITCISITVGWLYGSLVVSKMNLLHNWAAAIKSNNLYYSIYLWGKVTCCVTQNENQ